MKLLLYTLLVLAAASATAQQQDSATLNLLLNTSVYQVKIDGQLKGMEKSHTLKSGPHHISVYVPFYEVYDTTMVLEKDSQNVLVQLRYSAENKKVLSRRGTYSVLKLTAFVTPLAILPYFASTYLSRKKTYLEDYRELQESVSTYDNALSKKGVANAEKFIASKKEIFAKSKKRYTSACIQLTAATGFCAFLVYKGIFIKLPKFSDTSKVTFDAISINQTIYPCLRLQASF
jgi:hypothetical protein